jgi:hypothetical protein
MRDKYRHCGRAAALIFNYVVRFFPPAHIRWLKAMSNDSELLRQYGEERSERAFTELVPGHLNLVYSAALRETNDDMGLAQDISQAVFTELARKARRFPESPIGLRMAVSVGSPCRRQCATS